jgi:energy-coupling factor transporter ATP-binding protein EcfA2
MSELKAFLGQVHIENFLSLRDVDLPLKPLTVLVGPNASGKSNVLRALSHLKEMVIAEKLPPAKDIQELLWAGEPNPIAFQLYVKVKETPTVYKLGLKADGDNLLVSETLLVKDRKVISIQNGQGTVWDEDGENETKYKSNKLALKAAGNNGNKPVPSALTEFIENWAICDFRPDCIENLRPRAFVTEEIISGISEASRDSSQQGNGSILSSILLDWYAHDRECLRNFSESLAASTNFRIDQGTIGGGNQLCLLEGYEKPIPLTRASDGTLRLVAYNILLNLRESSPLIAIEEPERNLHPGAMTALAKTLGQLAERTQVIITTHSPQLLDAFKPNDLSDSLGVLLLRNHPGRGTEVINLETIRRYRPALDGWITDFGVGSAVFNSALL